MVDNNLHSRNFYEWLGLVMRWLARIWGFGLVLLAIAEIFAQDIVNPVPFAERLFIILFFASIILGYVLAWRWEGLGGMLLILSWIAFMLGASLKDGYWQWQTLENIFLSAFIFATPGILFVFSWLITHEEQQRPLLT